MKVGLTSIGLLLHADTDGNSLTISILYFCYFWYISPRIHATRGSLSLRSYIHSRICAQHDICIPSYIYTSAIDSAMSYASSAC